MRIRQMILAIPIAAAVIGLPPAPEGSGSTLTALWNAGAAEPASAHRYHRHHYRHGHRPVRRAVRRTAYLAVLPGGCARAHRFGRGYWRCGAVTYRSTYHGGRRVYVAVRH